MDNCRKAGTPKSAVALYRGECFRKGRLGEPVPGEDEILFVQGGRLPAGKNL